MNTQTWSSIFPDAKDSSDIPGSLRTMTQAWGGTTMAIPLMQFIR